VVRGAWCSPLLGVLGFLVAAGPLASQQVLNQFSYDNLRFTGIQAEIGALGSNKLRGALTGAVRVDYGFFAPSVRLLLGVGFYRAEFTNREIGEFERKLATLVTDPEDNATITVGAIRWADIVADADLQYMFPQGAGFSTYIGLGLSVHFRNGSGTAVDGTFVEDALDTIGAGLNVTVGGDVTLTSALRLTIAGRGVLSSELNTGSVSVGLKYQAGSPR
jgi:hypothetical protein